MRYFEDGPDIPNELIDACIQGNVVFFCGAGVSSSAKLKNFWQITKEIIDFIDPPSNSPIRKLFDKNSKNPARPPEKIRNTITQGLTPEKTPESLQTNLNNLAKTNAQANKLKQTLLEQLDGYPTAQDRANELCDPNRNDETPPYAEIYTLLQQTYGAELIETKLHEFIEDDKTTDVKNHKLILQLSQNTDGIPQVVTTNIDRLFDKTLKQLNYPKPDDLISIAPHLPIVYKNKPFSGLAYLHGRKEECADPLTRGNYVFSSIDFGQAYLSEGWATRFIQSLLSSHKSIVFIGYSADDTTVRYLLEALHVGGEDESLYAFSSHNADTTTIEKEAIEENWKHKGATAILYPTTNNKGKEHSALWDSIAKWHYQKFDPSAWNDEMVELAQKSPKDLKPYTRGQVIAFLGSAEGLRRFNTAHPTPPAEWLCVFDEKLRRTKPFDLKKEQFDPLKNYGLEGDLYLGEETDNKRQRFVGLKQYTESGAHYSILKSLVILPPLNSWFTHKMNEPITAWWAASLPSMPTWLTNQIAWALEQPASRLDEQAKKTWRLLQLAFKHKNPQGRDDDYSAEFSNACTEISAGTCSIKTLQILDQYLQPRVTVERASRLFSKTYFPEGSWKDVRHGDIAKFDVTFKIHNQIEKLSPDSIPAENLHDIFRIFCAALERTAQLLAQTESGVIGWRIENLPHNTTSRDHRTISPIWAKTAKLFDKLALERPERAKAEVLIWPNNCRFFFDKLKLYAWSNTMLYSAEEVCTGIQTLLAASLWNGNHEDQIIHLLKTHWGNMTPADRFKIEQRFRESWKKDSYRESLQISHFFGRLTAEELTLSHETTLFLTSIETAAELEEKVNQQQFIKACKQLGIVSKDDAYPPLKNTLNLDADSAYSPTKIPCFGRNFALLAKEHPALALSVLQDNGAPEQNIIYWQTLALRDNYQSTSDNRKFITPTFLKLPTPCLQQMDRSLPIWLGCHLPIHAEEELTESLNWWDSYFEFIMSQPEEFHTKERVSNHKDVSKHAYLHLSQTPTFMTVDVLLKIFEQQNADNAFENPLFIDRITKALNLEGSAKQQTICALSAHLKTLYSSNPEWTTEQIIPFFQSDFIESAWSGFFESVPRRKCSPNLYNQLTPCLIMAAPLSRDWRWRTKDASEKLAHFFAISGMKSSTLSDSEKRQLLHNLGDTGRCKIIETLAENIRDVDKNWPPIQSFIEKSWPLELTIKTPTLSAAMIGLIFDTKNRFPDATKLMLPLLGKTEHLSSYHNIDDLISVDAKCLLQLMDHVVADDPLLKPWRLGDILEKISEATPTLKTTIGWKRLYRIESA